MKFTFITKPRISTCLFLMHHDHGIFIHRDGVSYRCWLLQHGYKVHMLKLTFSPLIMNLCVSQMRVGHDWCVRASQMRVGHDGMHSRGTHAPCDKRSEGLCAWLRVLELSEKVYLLHGDRRRIHFVSQTDHDQTQILQDERTLSWLGL